VDVEIFPAFRRDTLLLFSGAKWGESLDVPI
jgi:hypothetical protein